MESLPQSVRTCLWSYDTSALDLQKDKRLIIFNVLNYGTEDAVRWLRATYPQNELVHAIETSSESEWSKKSLNYWSTLFAVHPTRTGRFS